MTQIYLDRLARVRQAMTEQGVDTLLLSVGHDLPYLTGPYEQPWRGHDEIVAKWLVYADQPGDADFCWQVVGVRFGPAAWMPARSHHATGVVSRALTVPVWTPQYQLRGST